MPDMRRLIALVESALRETGRGVGYFMHVTAGPKLPSILKQGLIPNHGGGSYDETRWVSLEGVYASQEPTHLRDYLRNHNLLNDYAILVIAVASGGSLPDEDLLEINLQQAYDAVVRKTGIDPIEGEGDEEQFGLGSKFWLAVGKVFHRLAAKRGAKIDDALVNDLVDYWADFQMNGGGDFGADEWAALKDRAVRAYPDIKHPVFGRQHSVRIPSTVGLTGDTRIVAAVEVQEDRPTTVYGAVPPAAKAMVDALIRG